MKEKLLEDMSSDEFEQVLDDFIMREQTEVSVSTFFQALALIDREKQETARMIRLQTRIVDGKLVVSPPESEIAIAVEGNKIMLEDGRRILLELVPGRVAV